MSWLYTADPPQGLAPLVRSLTGQGSPLPPPLGMPQWARAAWLTQAAPETGPTEATAQFAPQPAKDKI